MAYTQADRLIAIDTPLGSDVLLLRSVSGHEGVSRLFNFELDLLSTDAAIKFEDIIGKNVTVKISIGDDEERFFNGFISRFSQLGNDTGLANYHATMVPWLWFLSRTTDCRIFQNLSIPDIIKKIFSDLGFSDYKFNLKGTYQKWDYCVQYRETDLNFVARLMEQEGIFYFFEHEKKKHTLIVGDDASVHQPCSGQSKVKWNPQGSGNFDESVVTDLQLKQEFRPGKYALTDYNFETPSTSLMAQVDTTIAVSNNTKFEVYDYPGEYDTKGDGDTLAKVRMQEEEAQHLEVSGSSSCRTFTSGYRFTLEEYFRSDMNRDYLLTNLVHSASVGNTYTSQAGGSNQNYDNHFVCMPHAVPYRPPRITPRPVVQGPQTAVVVGPGGEEIYVDKYGRVKVQFFWDREGKKDEKSSCWVRVSQNWAGKQWGIIFIPRIGQEVIVEFMEGDPDQPIITGRVYNAEQMPPYELPANQTQSGIKTRSSKGGSPDNFNEIRFEDKKGEEQLFIHAEKNQDIEVENDETHSVGHDRKKDIKNDETVSVGHDRSETVGNNETIDIEKDRSETVGGNETISIGKDRTESVEKNESITIGESRTESVGKNEDITIGENRKEQVGKNEEVSIGGNRTLQIEKNNGVDVGKKFTLVAGDEISLTTGDASIVMKKNGDITINGNKITITGSGKITVKSDSDLIMKGSKITQN